MTFILSGCDDVRSRDEPIAFRICWADGTYSGLIAARVGSVRRVVCASEAYLSRHAPKPTQPGDLASHVCISFDGLTGTKSWVFRQGKKSVTVPVRSRLVVNTAEAAIDAAIAGLGVTRVLNYQIARALRKRQLVTILSDFEPDPVPVSLVHNGQVPLPLKVRAFLDFAAERLRKMLDSV